MLTAPPHPLSPGDRAPNFALPDQEGKVTMFYERVTGRPTVLIFTAPMQPPLRPAALAATEKALEDFASAGVDPFLISPMPAQAVQALAPKTRFWADPEGKITEALLTQLGTGGGAALATGPVAALLDENQRLIEVMTGADDLAGRILSVYAGRPAAPEPLVRRAGPPVLIMPNLLDPTMCRELIQLYRDGNPVEGTVAAVDQTGQVDKVHHARKKRLDFKIEDRGLHQILMQTLGRRMAPEMEKGFNFIGFAFDAFVVCRYAADREDRFRAHRDNLAPSTQSRRFALTLNLNGDEYEGGELTFPEYGPDRYKTGNGGGVIFSCSLLHEALPVTRGERFALLTFLRTASQRAGPQQGRAQSRRGAPQ